MERMESNFGLKYMPKDSRHRQGISVRPGHVSWNRNSGCAAISLAAQLGVKRIILLGFDMTTDKNKVTHWHGSHGAKRRNPPFESHMKGMAEIAKDAEKLDIEIINASSISAIDVFPKKRVRDLL